MDTGTLGHFSHPLSCISPEHGSRSLCLPQRILVRSRGNITLSSYLFSEYVYSNFFSAAKGGLKFLEDWLLQNLVALLRSLGAV